MICKSQKNLLHSKFFDVSNTFKNDRSIVNFTTYKINSLIFRTYVAEFVIVISKVELIATDFLTFISGNAFLSFEIENCRDNC